MKPSHDTTHRECHWVHASIFRGFGGRVSRKQSRSALVFYECSADSLRGASWGGKISCADATFVVVAGAGVAEAGKDVDEAGTGLVVDVVVSWRRRVSVQNSR